MIVTAALLLIATAAACAAAYRTGWHNGLMTGYKRTHDTIVDFIRPEDNPIARRLAQREREVKVLREQREALARTLVEVKAERDDWHRKAEARDHLLRHHEDLFREVERLADPNEQASAAQVWEFGVRPALEKVRALMPAVRS